MSTKPPSDYTAATTAYYDAHAAEFCENTAAVDMSGFYAPFLSQIPDGGRILDAGSGSGRDSAAFLQKGYQVVSIDASAEMVYATTKLTGQSAVLMRFDEMAYDSEFDGIWACASLLHVSRQDLPLVLRRITKSLKPGGVLYCSFKYGHSERIEHGRFFNDQNESSLESMLGAPGELEALEMWVTVDVRPDKTGQRWINSIRRKAER